MTEIDIIDKVSKKTEYLECLEYKVHIEDDIEQIINIIKSEYGNCKLYLITDDNVNRIYNNEVESLTKSLDMDKFIFANGEDNKNIETISSIYSFLIENNADRESVVIALGGGIVGDLVGFVASSYMRGIKYISIPTTLISQVDSCIGGKVGYNFANIKNAIGAFYNPSMVIICNKFISTLSEKDYRSGLGEVIKYGIISSKEVLEILEAKYEEILKRDLEVIRHLVKLCIDIKSKVVASDFLDNGYRNILNFGHTVGHAIEMDSNFAISHGEAVALGILCAIKLSEKKLALGEDLYLRVIKLYEDLGLSTNYKVDNFQMFLYAINHDKKNVDGVRFVLINKNNECEIKVKVNHKEIIEAIQESICR